MNSVRRSRLRSRRLLLPLVTAAVLLIGTFSVSYATPIKHYLAGTEVTVAAEFRGAGCGTHIQWDQEQVAIEAGTRLRFVNSSGFGSASSLWEIPVQIEKLGAGGEREIVYTSPPLRDGESWSYLFWETGDYIVTSSNTMIRYAGLESSVSVTK